MLTRRQSIVGLGADFECVGNAPRGSPSEIRVLTLEDGQHQESTLYRLQKGWRLQFRLGPSLFGKRVLLHTNHPAEATEGFDRSKYRALSWRREEGKSGDDTAAYAEIQLSRPGSFHYYFTYDGSVRHGSGFLTVQPVLKMGDDEVLPLDCIQCQTVLAKSLGPFDTWQQKLMVTKESGYNMIHFTPVQELGGSNSSYSLSNQLRLNPAFNFNDRDVTIADLEALTDTMRRDWKVLSMCDIVLNHTANETTWLQDHPECTYNCVNSPHLRPAYLLDAALAQLSDEVADGKWLHSGIPPDVNTEEHLNNIRRALHDTFLPRANIPSIFSADVAALAVEFYTLARSRLPAAGHEPGQHLKILPDPMYGRGKAGVDMELALKLYNVYRADCFDEDTRLARCTEAFRAHVSALNEARLEEVRRHLETAVDNSIAGMRYFRVQSDGPRVKVVTRKDPLVPRYFTSVGQPATMNDEEKLAYGEDGRFLMAHNGWVMDSDPLSNFAASDSNVYLRRELIAWGDSVKLRYGEKPEDCPYLWQLMKEYVEQTARVFDGIRLDNCHSTPLNVAEYLLDAARNVRPDLYVAAELFTNSDEKDNIFVNSLGITSLIREAMSAWDSHELGRLVYRYGGEPVGAFYQPACRPLAPSIAHALFLDQTHDNQSPVEKRSAFDLLPSAALVAMACCASGSNRGYDELVPHHIHVVDEHRHYAAWHEDTVANPTAVNLGTGIISAKRALNKLHYHLGRAGFTQVFVDQMDGDVVAVTRHCPATRESVIMVAHTAFSHPIDAREVKPLRVEGAVVEVVLEATLAHQDTELSRFTKASEFVKHPSVVGGLSEYRAFVRESIPVEESTVLRRVDSGDPNVTQLDLHDFPPGSCVAVRVRLNDSVAPSVAHLNRLLSGAETGELNEIVNALSLPALNRALYRCAEEERDEDHTRGAYDVPGWGPLVYCGLQGFESVLCDIRAKNDLGHPLCNNLRLGNWMMEYISSRLERSEDTRHLGAWLARAFTPVGKIPRYLVPAYFDYIVTQTYQVLLEAAWARMDPFITDGSAFIRALALGSVQCTAVVESAQLPTLAEDLGNATTPILPTLCAGLPHFTVGYMRNWGRDTFISLRGLLLLTGRYQDAKNHILGYAACLRHGLIPNLLDGGGNARFNCRDAVWWWLHAIANYATSSAPDARQILKASVVRLYPSDESGTKEQPLYDVIQEALETHFQGLAFRERRAGRDIDAHMTDQGFNVQIGVHPETGFVFGGNAWNCGTWMDKMGSSERAGTRGRPASPRDGSAVELVGLSKRALAFLAAAAERGDTPHRAVVRRHKDGSTTTWTYREWEQRIAAHFERHFFVSPEGPPESKLVHRRGIYKDTFRSSLPYADYQLRPNFPVAMVVAPEMFDPAHAWAALMKVEELLLGPLGMRTLDPADWAYDGDYNNANDSDDPKLAHGFNYHNGPEWVWPMGYFLRARLMFARSSGGPERLRATAADTRRVLARHFSTMQSDAWRGLPELTNKDGAYCKDSCRTQAWSMACILEVLHDLSLLDGNNGAETSHN